MVLNVVIPVILVLLTGAVYVQLSHYKHQLLYMICVFAAALPTAVIVNKPGFAFAVDGICILLLLVWLALLKGFGEYLRYKGSEVSSVFFQGKKVMVLIPHQDDELNLASDMLERYLANGSEVFIVYATNGDYQNLGAIRMQEALAVCKELGVDEEHVIFLGYGDQWQPYTESGGKQVRHIYHADGAVPMTSHAGYQKTYALETKEPFSKDQTYTREHYCGDIKKVIMTYLPDVLYTVDFDPHSDHRAVSLLFEEALGSILKEDASYRPKVYKGFCYSTAYYAADDFYEAFHLKSTVSLSKTAYMEENHSYFWEDRVRIPVTAEIISRSLPDCKTYRLLSKYTTQPALEKAGRVINGDKVFWERSTKSVLYDAEISDSHGKVTCLNNFKLSECDDIMDKNATAQDRYWAPEKSDVEHKTAGLKVSLPEKRRISGIWIYGFLGPDSGRIRLAVNTGDEKIYRAELLPETKFPVKIAVEQREIREFTINIEEWEADAAGLLEVEAYEEEENQQPALIKLMDSGQNFVYQDLLTEDKKKYEIYTYPKSDGKEILEKAEISLLDADGGCSYTLENGGICVTCPKGAHGSLKVSIKGAEEIADTISFEHLSGIKNRIVRYVVRHSGKEVRLYYKTLIGILLRHRR